MKTYLLFSFIFVAFNSFSQPITYQTIRIPDMGFIALPSNMEIQSGQLKRIVQQYLTDVGLYSYEVAGDRIVFQPRGLNEGQRSNTFARVIIRTHKGRHREYPNLHSNHKYSERALLDFGNAFKSASFSSQGPILVRWYGVQNIMLNNKYNGIKYSYLRQSRNNTTVRVIMYTINNNDRIHDLTFSYTEEDSDFWLPIVNKMIESIYIIQR